MKRRSNLAITVDIVTLIPLYLLYHGSRKGNPHTLFLLHLPTYLRFYRVFIFFKRRAALAGAHRVLLFYVRYIILLLVSIHIFTCLWYDAGCKGNEDCGGQENWVNRMKTHFGNVTEIWDWYLLCSYYAITTFVNLGYGDIHSTNRSEYGLTSAGMILGFILTTVMFVGSVSSHRLEQTSRFNSYRRKISSIKSRLEVAGFTPREVREQLSFFELIWYKNFLCIIESTESLHILPLSMQRELCYGINVQMFTKSLLLKEIEAPYLRTISLLIKTEFYHPGDVIVHRGTVKEKLVMVKFGEIDILSEEDDESSIITFSAGTCLSECALVMVWPAKTVIRARTFTALQVLHHADFNRVLADYPQKIIQLRLSVKERISLAQKEIIRRDEVEDEGVPLSLVPVTTAPQIKVIKDKLAQKENRRHALPMSLRAPVENKFFELYETHKPRISTQDLSTTSTLPILCLGKFPWIFMPDTVPIQVWECAVVFTAIIISFLYPHFLAFESKFLSRQAREFDTVVDIMFVVDVYVQCTTAMEKKGELIASVSAIVAHQVTTPGFYLDVLAILPTQTISYLLNDTKHRYHPMMRMNRLLKCWKILQFFNKKESDLWANVVLWKVTKYCLLFLITAYWSAAILFMTACFDTCAEDSWFMKLVRKEKGKADPLYMYKELVSFYLALNTMCGVGFGNVTAGNLVEVGCIMVVIFMGVLLLGFYMAEFATAFYFGGRLRAIYQEKYTTTLQFMVDKGINPEIIQRAHNFLSLQWNYDKGNSVIQEWSRFPTISEKHQERILFKERIEALQQLPMFQLTDLNMLMLVAKEGKIRVLPPGEYIYRAGSWMRTMYIIQEGYCMLLDQHNEELGTVLGPVTLLGSLAMFYKLKSICSIRTITDCKLISINRKTYTRITSIFPIILETNNEVAKEFNDRVTNFFESYTDSPAKRIYVHPPSIFCKQETIGIRNKLWSTYVRPSFLDTGKSNGSEDYWKPFESLGGFNFLGHLFMPWSILPTSWFLTAWCISRVIIVSNVALVLLIDKSVDSNGTGSKLWMIPIDLFAYLDIYLMFHVAYYNEKGILVTHPLYTARRYLKSNFCLDVVACFPFEWLVRSKFGKFRQILKLNRMLQTYRLMGALRYIGSDVFKPRQLLHLAKHVPFFLILANIWTTIFVSFNCTAADNGTMSCQKGSFIRSFQFQNATSPYDIYIISYYWVTSVLFCYSLVSAENSFELKITPVLIVSGFLLFGFTSAIVSSNKLQKNTDLILFKDKLKEIRAFMNQEAVPGPVKTKIISHFEYKLLRTMGLEIHDMFPFFNPTLKEDAYLSHFEKPFRKVPILFSPNNHFIRQIGLHIREYFFMTNQTIIQAYYIEANVYIIIRGHVLVFDESLQFLAELGPGDMFGNLQNSRPTLSNVTATCKHDVDILLIPSDVFQENLEFHTAIKDRIQSELEQTQYYIKQAPQPLSKGDAPDDTLFVLPVSLKPRNYVSLSVSNRKPPENRIREWWQKTIMPTSPFLMILDIVVLLCSYITIWKATFQIAFQPRWPLYVHTVSLLDLVFFTNMFVESRRAYITMYGKTVTDHHLTTERYLRSKKFIFETIINLPYYFGSFFAPYEVQPFWYSVLQLIHIFRMYYIIKFYKEHHRTETMSVNASSSIVWVSLFIHFSSCVLYFIACPLAQCNPNSWITKTNSKIQTPMQAYLISVYFTVDIMTGTCYGSIHPYNMVEVSVIILMMMACKFAVCMLIAEVTDLLCSVDRVLNTYERNMHTMQDMLKSQDASDYQKHKVWHYVRKLWKYEHGVQKPCLLDQMPVQLKIELLWEVYGHHLQQAFPFRGLDICFLQQLVTHLNHTVYFTGNYVVRSGDVDLSMHFVHRGEVAILTVQKDSSENIHDILKEGDMFGIAQGLYRGLPHCFSYRAHINTDILSLHLDSWTYLLLYYPHLQKQIYERVNNLRKNPSREDLAE